MRKRYITLNSKGSAIVTVVVSMMFIMALGAALLFTAYTAYSVQITQRGDKANFYDASSAMDDMRLGVQTILSQSIAEAYTDVIASYINQPEGYNPQADFNQKIIDRLATKTVTVGGASSAIFTYSTVSGKTMITGCNSGALAAFIEVVPSDATVTVTVGGAETGSSEVSIKALGVKYVSADGYESDIKSDIVIAMPSFFASSKAVSSINHYTIIANNSISQSSGGPLSISGSVFAGNGGVSVTGSGNSLTLTGGNLVCRGRLLIDN
ncbi:MAG: hypothetical protein VB064_08680, partial [Oscillospiraceae bacterium]|nr:hypothetical protein [Oscillospiraceae bacterium]